MKTKFFLLLTIFVGNLNLKSELSAQTTAKEITDSFFETYAKDPMKAVDYAFSTNKWIGRKKDDVDNLKSKLKGLLDLVGDYYGYEIITEKTSGVNLKLITYMVKYDREPLRFTFLLYKPQDKWQVQNFSYDENLDEDLQEAAKLYRLKENN